MDGGNDAQAAGCSFWRRFYRVEDRKIQQNLNMFRKYLNDLFYYSYHFTVADIKKNILEELGGLFESTKGWKII